MSSWSKLRKNQSTEVNVKNRYKLFHTTFVVLGIWSGFRHAQATVQSKITLLGVHNVPIIRLYKLYHTACPTLPHLTRKARASHSHDLLNITGVLRQAINSPSWQVEYFPSLFPPVSKVLYVCETANIAHRNGLMDYVWNFQRREVRLEMAVTTKLLPLCRWSKQQNFHLDLKKVGKVVSDAALHN